MNAVWNVWFCIPKHGSKNDTLPFLGCKLCFVIRSHCICLTLGFCRPTPRCIGTKQCYAPGGGRTASLRVGTQNKTTDPRFYAITALSHCPCCFTAPCFCTRHRRKAYCYYCCYRGLPPVDIIFSYPDTKFYS